MAFINKSIISEDYFKCCYKCPNRTKLCHDSCKTYLEAKKKYEEFKKKVQSEKDIICHNAIRRMKKREV